jgi:hypothetical protein
MSIAAVIIPLAAILSLAGSTEVQPVRPLAALMNAPPAGDAETLVQSFVPSQEPSTLPIAPPADSTGALHTLAATTGGPPAAYEHVPTHNAADHKEKV